MKALTSALTFSLASTLVTAFAVPARADGITDSMPAPEGGLELGLVVGSATTVGDVGGGMDADDLIGTAAQAEIQIGYRVKPYLGLAFYASGQALTEGSSHGRDVYAGSAGLAATFHMRPRSTIDPWISVGGGLRSILIDDDARERAKPSLIVGVELARLQVGFDYRVSPDFAVGPVFGASASLYGAQKTPMGGFAELDDKGVNWTFTAGLGGRFNAFGKRI
jgi:hypothetical protein